MYSERGHYSQYLMNTEDMQDLGVSHSPVSGGGTVMVSWRAAVSTDLCIVLKRKKRIPLPS